MRHLQFRPAGFSRRAAWLAGLTFAVVFHGVQAGTIVRFSTTYGDFSVETLDEAAPATTQNFLNYVNRGDYNGTFIHRMTRGSVDGLDVLQGGGYRFHKGLVPVPQDPPVVNEFNVSNTIGTLAMAKFADQPDSATSQWFINTKDNAAALDNNTGGFTVFARILGDGMNVVNAMVDNPVYNLGSLARSIPLRADTSAGVLNPQDPNVFMNIRANHLITINTLVTQRFSAALHVFEHSSGRLITSVNGGDDGKFSLNLSLVASEPQIVFELNVDSMVPLAVTPDGMATWSSSDNRLRIPVIEINDNGNVSQITNAVFVLSDPALQRFTLESYDQ